MFKTVLSKVLVTMEQWCVVNGLLPSVLMMCRLFGIAPISFSAVPEGYSIRLSKLAVYYSRFLLSLLCIIEIIFISYEVLYFTDTKMNSRYHHVGIMKHVVLFTNLILMIINSCIIIATGSDRMRSNIECLTMLNQVNNRLKEKTIRYIIVIIYVLIRVVFILVEMVLKFYDSAFSLPRFIGNILCDIHHMVLTIIEIKIFAMAFEIHNRLRSIEMELAELNENMRKTSVAHSEADLDTMELSLRTIRKSFVVTCECISQIEASENFLFLFLITMYAIQIIFTADQFATYLDQKQGLNDYIMFCGLDIAWFVYHYIRSIVFIEPWHCISEEVQKIKYQLGETLCILTQNNRESWEARIFYVEALINKSQITPMGIFTIIRSLHVQVLGVVITYSVVVVQINN